MFHRAYFGGTYFAPDYFADGIGDTALMTPQTVTSTASYAPIQTVEGMAGYVRSDTGSYSVIVTSRGTP